MKYLNLFSFLIFILLNSSFAHAHPVSFQGSKGIMGYHAPFMTHNQLNYSFKHWFAVGVHHFRMPELETSASFVSTNFLLKRWNGKALQANIYTSIGYGISDISGNNEDSALGAIQFDIEDRDYYFLTKHTIIANEADIDMQQTVVRLGFSPYVDDYDGIHSWLILEWQSMDSLGDNDITDLTPFLRIFYRNFLFEIGQSFDGLTKFNFITHL